MERPKDETLDGQQAGPMTEEDRARSWWAGLEAVDPREEGAAAGRAGVLNAPPEESR